MKKNSWCVYAFSLSVLFPLVVIAMEEDYIYLTRVPRKKIPVFESSYVEEEKMGTYEAKKIVERAADRLDEPRWSDATFNKEIGDLIKRCERDDQEELEEFAKEEQLLKVGKEPHKKGGETLGQNTVDDKEKRIKELEEELLKTRKESQEKKRKARKKEQNKKSEKSFIEKWAYTEPVTEKNMYLFDLKKLTYLG